jgi:hypothetical protein
MNNSWKYQGLEDGILIQLTTLEESDSTIIFLLDKSPLKDDNSNAFATAINSASLESLIPTEIENTPITNPMWSRKTPPVRVGPGFPEKEPLTFHLTVESSKS